MTPAQSLMMTRVMEVVPNAATLKFDSRNGDVVWFEFISLNHGLITGYVTPNGKGGRFQYAKGHSIVPSDEHPKLASILECPAGCHITGGGRGNWMSFWIDEVKDTFETVRPVGERMGSRARNSL